MTDPGLSAVLLAAGHSIRMHRDKALLERDGRPMWQRQLEVLRQAGAAEIYLSARDAQTWADTAEGFTAVVRDPAPDAGPLGGITAALERSPTGHLAVLAVDLPRMQAGWFAGLRAACAPGVGAVGRNGRFFEPLAAIYPRELLPLAQEALAQRQLSLQKLLAAAVERELLRVCEISADNLPLFTNWNEPG